MRTISTGQPSNLKTYREIALVLGGFDEENPAVKFIDQKILQSEKGEYTEVIADETQMIHLLGSLALVNEEDLKNYGK